MLQFIRDTAKGWVAWLIIGLLIIPFALWGINEYFQGGSAANIATVNGEDISLRIYQQTYQQQRARIKSMLGSNANPDMIDQFLKPEDIIDGLIERQLLIEAATDDGYRIADQSIVKQIQSIEAFQQDGRFSKPAYERALRNQGYSTGYFESSMLSDSLISQINSGIRGTAIVANAEVDNYIRLKNQEREITYLTIPVSQYEAKVVISDEEYQKYYDDNLQRFVNPEKVSLDYVELDIKDIQATISFTEEELLKAYDEQKDRYGVGEERQAKHILIQISDSEDEKSVNKALDKANKIAARIKAGESFETLAKSSSDDSGSANQGGDLGFFGKNIMDPAFEAAAFAMKEDEISDPVKSSFGYHIIKLEKIRAGSHKPFTEVREEIIKVHQQQKAEAQFFDKIELMANAAYEQPDSLDAVAEALNQKIKSTEKFPMSGGKGIAANQKLLQVAFSNDVLKQKYNSEPIEISVNHLVVVRLKEHEPETQKSLDEVKSEISKLLIKQAASAKAEEAGKETVKNLKQGSESTSVAKKLGLEWKAKAYITRTENKLSRDLVDAVFKQKKPVEGKVSTNGIKLNTGDYVVYQLFNVKNPDVTKIADAEKKKFTSELSSLYSNAEYDKYLTSLKNQADILIFAENIE